MLTTVLALAVMAGINRWWGRSWLYPPAVFSAWWALTVFILYLTSSLFYPVGDKALFLFLLGAVGFSLGGMIVSLLEMTSAPSIRLTHSRQRRVEMALDATLLLAFACLPTYLLYLRQLAGSSLLSIGAWHVIRNTILELQNLPGGAPFRPEQSLLPVFSIMALLAAYEHSGGKRRRLRTWAMITVALFYELLSSARSGIFLLLLGLVAITSVKRRRFPIWQALVGSVVFSLIFVGNQITLEKMGVQANASFADNLPMLAEGAAAYAVGGLVGFDLVVHNPHAIENGWTLSKFFLRTANKFGAKVDEPSRKLQFTPISPHITGNVYSIYFPFFVEYGSVGVFLLPCLLGFIVTLAYRRSLRGNRLGVLFYCLGLYGIFMSPFAESFFGEMGFWLKALFIASMLYGFPMWRPRKAIASFQPAPMRTSLLKSFPCAVGSLPALETSVKSSTNP